MCGIQHVLNVDLMNEMCDPFYLCAVVVENHGSICDIGPVIIAVRIREMRELLQLAHQPTVLSQLLHQLLQKLLPYHQLRGGSDYSRCTSFLSPRTGHVLAHFVTSTCYPEKVMGGAVIAVVRICHSCLHVKTSWNRFQNTVDVISLT